MKHHLNQKHLASALALLLGLLLLLHSCRKEHAVPTANVLASYKGSDKNVLKIIEELKKPENNTLLANLNQQGEVDWQNYQAMLTSDFMQGLTLRFYQGPDSNYFDAQLNPETKAIRLLSKTQKLVEREHAIAQLKAESKAKDKTTTTYTSFTCKAMVDFEYVLYTNRTTFSINDSFDDYYFAYIYNYFIVKVREQLLNHGFALNPTYYKIYADGYIPYSSLYPQVIQQIRQSFQNALVDLQLSPVGSGYYINGFLTRVGVAPPTCTTGDGGGGGDGDGGDGDTDETIELVQINIPLKYCNFNFQQAFGVEWQAAGIRGIGIILAPNDGPLIFDIEVGLPMYSIVLGRTISRLEAQRESANAYMVAMGIVNALYSAGQISKTAIPGRVASEMQKELNRSFGFTAGGYNIARVSKTLGVNQGAPTSRANFNLNCP